MDRSKNLAKNTIILGLGQLIPKLLSIIMLPLLTYNLSTEDYGVYDLILSFSSLVIPLSTLLIQQGAFRYLITADCDESKKKIITNTLLFGVSSLFILGIICFPLVRNQFGTIGIYIILLYVTESLYDITGQIVRGLGKNIIYSAAIIAYSTINLLLTVVFLRLGGGINIARILITASLSYLAGTAVLLLSSRCYKYISPKLICIDTIKSLCKYSMPIIPSSISLWVVNLSDRLLIISILGASMNGIYAAANKIPNLIGSLYSIFNLAWTESATRAVNDNDKNEFYSSLYMAIFDFLLLIVVATISFSDIIFNILIDKAYSEGIYQMPILIIGIFYSSLVSFYGGIYVALQKTREVGISSLVGALLNLAINFFTIRYIGLYAASISTAISYFLIFIYRRISLKKFIEIRYKGLHEIISYSIIIISVILFYINTIYSKVLLYIVLAANCVYFIVKYKSFIMNVLTKKNNKLKSDGGQ